MARQALAEHDQPGSPVPGHQIGGTSGSAQPGADLAENAIAELVTEALVGRGHIVDLDADDPHQHLLIACPLNGLVHAVDQDLRPGQAGD